MAPPTTKIAPTPPVDQTQQLSGGSMSSPSVTQLSAPKVAAFYGGGLGPVDPTDANLASEPVPAYAQMEREPSPLSHNDLPTIPQGDLLSRSKSMNTPRMSIPTPDAAPYMNMLLHSIFLQTQEASQTPLPVNPMTEEQPMPPQTTESYDEQSVNMPQQMMAQ